MWCHVLLAMPVIGLSLFLVLPWPLAIAGYAPIAVFSLLMYRKVIDALRLPVQAGPESLLGTTGVIVAIASPNGLASYLVRARGEIWSVQSEEGMIVGDTVQFASFDSGLPTVKAAGDKGNDKYVSAGRCH